MSEARMPGPKGHTHTIETPHAGFLPLGSWSLNVYASRPSYLEVLGSLFRQDVSARPLRMAHEVDAELVLRACPDASPPFASPATAELEGDVAGWEDLPDGARQLFTGRMRVLLARSRQPVRITIDIREPQFSERAFRDHLLEVMVTLLAALDRYYVHAAGIETGGRVNVFVGEGSFGKTTVTLRLAREGATVLSEDHVLFTRKPGGFLVSGCQETARLTPKTERFFFGDDGMRAGQRCDDGKKEFRVGDFFQARPYEDAPFHRIFFNRIGKSFSIRPMPKSAALLRLVHMTKGFYRWSRPVELEAYLTALEDLVEGPELLALELSPRLSDLDRLVEYVSK